MDESRDAIRSGIADVINSIDPGLRQDLERDAAAHLRVISIVEDIRSEAEVMLHETVGAARSSGVSWERIGGELHTSRQGAQRRFGQPAPQGSQLPSGDAQTWRLAPVTAFDELERLNEAGRSGWHSVGFGLLFHDLERSDEQWEHCRASMLSSREALEADGWQKIGTMWFPWSYYARPTGQPALPDPPGVQHAQTEK